MALRVDPEENEINALFRLASLGGKRVLEIGSGDGRLTWRFGHQAGFVTAIEPFAESVKRAKRDLPSFLKDRVRLLHIGFEEFAARTRSESFDIALLSWALC